MRYVKTAHETRPIKGDLTVWSSPAAVMLQEEAMFRSEKEVELRLLFNLGCEDAFLYFLLTANES